MTAVDVLRSAKELLINEGWVQGAYHRTPDIESSGPYGYCLIGALGKAASGQAGHWGIHPRGDEAQRAGYEAALACAAAVPADHPVRGEGCGCPSCRTNSPGPRLAETFSESADTTVEDVIALIDTAAARLASGEPAPAPPPPPPPPPPPSEERQTVSIMFNGHTMTMRVGDRLSIEETVVVTDDAALDRLREVVTA